MACPGDSVGPVVTTHDPVLPSREAWQDGPESADLGLVVSVCECGKYPWDLHFSWTGVTTRK